MKYAMGIDIGSTTSKGIILNDRREIVSSFLVHAGTGTGGPQQVRSTLLSEAGLTDADIGYTVVTGYGRTPMSRRTQG